MRHTFPLYYETENLKGPTQRAVDYEAKVFRSESEKELLEYQGPPSLVLDERWKGLYKCGHERNFEISIRDTDYTARWNT